MRWGREDLGGVQNSTARAPLRSPITKFYLAAIALILLIAAIGLLDSSSKNPSADLEPVIVPDSAAGNAVEETEPTPVVSEQPADGAEESCEPPTGLTEMQQYLHFGGCDYIVVETLDDGSLVLVSGSEELFRGIDETYSQGVPDPAEGSSRISSGRSGNSSPGSGPAPPPAESATPAPQPSYENDWLCPTSRDENPAVYDACYGGFIEPSVIPVGIVSCSPANEERTSWNIEYRFELSGGSYRSVSWSGVSNSYGNSAGISMTVNGVGEESFGNRIPVTQADIGISFGSMDPRYVGLAGHINFSSIVEDDYSACR
jgi:hypothetical protein